MIKFFKKSLIICISIFLIGDVFALQLSYLSPLSSVSSLTYDVNKIESVLSEFWNIKFRVDYDIQINNNSFSICETAKFSRYGDLIFMPPENFHSLPLFIQTILRPVCIQTEMFKNEEKNNILLLRHGNHTITSILLMQLKKDDFIADKVVVDFGTGDAILAMVAAKLGAKKIIGYEKNKDLVDYALKNIAQNGYDEKRIQVKNHNFYSFIKEHADKKENKDITIIGNLPGNIHHKIIKKLLHLKKINYIATGMLSHPQVIFYQSNYMTQEGGYANLVEKLAKQANINHEKFNYSISNDNWKPNRFKPVHIILEIEQNLAAKKPSRLLNIQQHMLSFFNFSA